MPFFCFFFYLRLGTIVQYVHSTDSPWSPTDAIQQSSSIQVETPYSLFHLTAKPHAPPSHRRPVQSSQNDTHTNSKKKKKKKKSETKHQGHSNAPPPPPPPPSTGTPSAPVEKAPKPPKVLRCNTQFASTKTMHTVTTRRHTNAPTQTWDQTNR
ncbi:hypothetical protein IWX91DRAFT_53412 [Phyllosticta citricarpa]